MPCVRLVAQAEVGRNQKVGRANAREAIKVGLLRIIQMGGVRKRIDRSLVCERLPHTHAALGEA